MINDQGDLSQVEIINDEGTSTMVPANLVDHGELSSEVGPSDNCRGQSPSELPSILDVPSMPTVAGNNSADAEEHSTITTASTSHTVTPCTVAVPPPEHEGELRYISPYLIQYVPVKAKKTSAAGKRAPGARVLTSDECAQILAEREEKKKKELEEKAKRKEERERKKQEKEAAAKEKAEKRKEASRQRAEKKASKDAELLASKSSTRSKSTRRCSKEGEQQSTEANEEDPVATLETIGAPPEQPPEQFPEDENQCCVCFEMYEPDTEWVQCVCKRWLHEDCYTEVLVDKYGRELLCPFCVR